MKYTCTLVRIYTNIHIPIDTYTLIMFMFKTYDSFHSPAINIHIGYIYILTPALVTLEDGLKGRNQTATKKILTHTATAAPDANMKARVQGQAYASPTYHVPHNSFHRRHDI